MAPNFNARIKAVDPERFQFALGVYQAAAAMKGPYLNPQEYSLNLVDRGAVTNIRFTDIPENRGMMAIKEQFPDPDEFQCIGFRVMTFSEVLKDRHLIKKGLIRKSDDGSIEVHESVISALAAAPFRKSGALDKRAFLSLVKSEHKRLETDDGGNYQ